eukprot:c29049_g1_i2 orf=451-2451(+)
MAVQFITSPTSEAVISNGSYYVPLPESSPGSGSLVNQDTSTSIRRFYGHAIVGCMLCIAAILAFVFFTSPCVVKLIPMQTVFLTPVTLPHISSGVREEMADSIVNTSSIFYMPKSKEPTILYKGGRAYPPWSLSNQRSLRTAFHFQPQKNWMNDPNGPLHHRGWYHLFYQYNPNAAVWGRISWGHAVSRDLIHWLYLDEAMVPDQWYDYNGVWTGSATFLRDGTPIIVYTGSANDSTQVQNLALPEDLSDPLLRRWVKFSGNPILFPPSGIAKTDFRDPSTAWLGTDGLWRLVIGSKIGKTGIAIVYQSSDFKNWKKQDHFLHQVQGTGMLECIDFFPIPTFGSSKGLDTSANGVDVKHVLKASMDSTKVDYYVIGTYNEENHTFTPDHTALDLGYGLRYDYGKYYASKTFFDPVLQRRILWGWVNESDSEQDDIWKGWASVQAVPRQIWFDNRTKANLIQWPVEEFLDLRSESVKEKDVLLEEGSIRKVDVLGGAQLDIEITIQNPRVINSVALEEEDYHCSPGGAAHRGVLGPFGLLVLSADDMTEQTAVYFYQISTNGTVSTRICSDQSRSSLAPHLDKSVYGSVVPVLEDEDELSMRVMVDRSIVETYAQGGRTCITSRVYPTKALDNEAHLFLFNNGTLPVKVKSLEVWQMNRVPMRPFFS